MASIAFRSAGILLVTQVEVSLWTAITARISCPGVLAQTFGKRLGISATMPVAGKKFGRQTETFCHLRPLDAELSIVECDDLVAWIERIDERGFPRAGRGPWKNSDLARGLEDSFHTVNAGRGQSHRVRAAMVVRWIGDGMKNPVGNIGGTGELKEMTAWLEWHGTNQFTIG